MVNEGDDEISKIRARSRLRLRGWVETEVKSVGWLLLSQPVQLVPC